MSLTLTYSRPPHPSLSLQITVSGGVDATTKDELLSTALHALATGQDVLIDAAGIDFIDCYGATTFVEIAAVGERAQRTFVLGARSARLQYVLDLLGLGEEWTGWTDTISDSA